jgi:hypothetical protein
MAIMVLVLKLNLIPDPQRSEEEKLVTRQTPSQCPPTIGHMVKANKEIPHRLTRITLPMDSIKTRPLPAIRPICHHQSIRHSRSLREESSYVRTTANGGGPMMLAAETSHHDEKLVKMADPSKTNSLAMMTARTTAETGISIALPTAAMTKGKAPAAVMMIQLHEE